MEQKECTGVEIKVPWGHISGKWWGPQTSRPLLALHGWQDNAGTFDTLIPLLPPHIGVLAIDFPGHGFSSRLPNGLMYNYLDYLNLIHMIMKEYGWNKVSILGHSMGAIIGFQMATIFPKKVDLLIGLDAYRPISINVDNVNYVYGYISNKFLEADKLNQSDSEPPSYSYDELIDKLYYGAASSIDRDKCPYILERNIKKSMKYPDKYYFTRDSRLKFINTGIWPHDVYLKLAENIQTPYLFVRALQSSVSNKKTDAEIINKLKENPLYEYNEVDGMHHVHLNEPEKVRDVVNPFLLKHLPMKGKL